MAVEKVRYQSYSDCLDSLKRMGGIMDEILPTLEHEKSHFEKAIELGYKPVYGIRMVVDRPPIVLAGFIDFDGDVPQGQDMIDILLAPAPPGEDDLKLVERIKKEMSGN